MTNRNLTKNTYLKLIYLYLSLIILITIFGCGKKGDPTLKSYEKPDPPYNLNAIHRESEIILSWSYEKTKQKNIKSFILFKSSGDKFEKLATLTPETRSYIDKDFKYDFPYKYKIISQSLKDVLSIDSNVIEIKPTNPPLSPSNVRLEIDKDKIIIKWDEVNEEVYYNIYKTHEKGKYSLIPINKNPIKESYFIDKLDMTKPYFYTIRSLKNLITRDEGPPSIEIVFNPSEITPPAPKNLQAVIKTDSIYLIWNECEEPWITGYKIYRQMTNEDEYKFVGETKIPSFIDKENPDIKRNYRVTSTTQYKESQPTEIKNIFYKKKR